MQSVDPLDSPDPQPIPAKLELDEGDYCTRFNCADPNWNPSNGDIVVMYFQTSLCFMAPFGVVKNRVKGRKTFDIESIKYNQVSIETDAQLFIEKPCKITSYFLVPEQENGQYTPTAQPVRACYFSKTKESQMWKVKMHVPGEEHKGQYEAAVVPYVQGRWYRSQ